jgi:hypothetical protein
MTATPTAMTAPALLPCPFCGSTRVSIDDLVGGVFVSCDLCEARGPFVDYTQVNYPASMFRSVSVAPNGDTIDPPVAVVGQSNDEYKELREKATREAQAAAIAAWNQRSAWQPIETAPRDGTKILAWDGDEWLVAWCCQGSGWISDELQEWHPGEREYPTHWQPHPSPPPIIPEPPPS